ncbi:MAG: 23S rRNA (cytidine(2498)-2'-O)-methyltransferase RlmM [Pseudomonadota bacterium]
MSGLFLFCRPGFEGECAAEMQDKSAQLGISGYAKAKPDSGYVVFVTYQVEDAVTLHERLAFAQLVFSRQWFIVLAMRNDLPVTDRITPICEALSALPGPAADLLLETPDTNEAKELSGLCRSLERPLARALEQQNLLQRQGAPDITLHICFLSATAAYIGYARSANSARWAMGIPRLKFPPQAPSRSTLKLEEAFLCFLDETEREELLHTGMTAVDLGACPGGWTWQLVRRHLYVTAIDNGPMADSVMDTGLVTHLRVDGFRYAPEAPVDWMVCDMVEQPIRIADLVARWIERGWCRYTIFNLKLPMKKRYLEYQRCLALLDERLRSAGIGYRVRAKQLYHDREEITVFLARD